MRIEIVYRHYDKDGVLLYVGQSNSPLIRLQQHEDKSHWSHQIETIRIERFDDQISAISAESRAIDNENPLYNVRRRDRGAGMAAARARGVRMGPKHLILDCPKRFAKFVEMWKSCDIPDGTLSARDIAAVLNAVEGSKLAKMKSHTSYANWKARGFNGFDQKAMERV